MLKRLLLSAAFAIAPLSTALAQSSVLPYFYNGSNVKTPTGTGSPLPVTGSFTPSGNTVVVGPTADGSPASTPPVLVGGTADGTATGAVDVWKVDAGGNGFVTDSTGAVTQAPVAPAIATATKSDLIGCQATSAGINPTTGQQAAVDCDLNNNLLVSAGGAPNLTIAQVSIATSDTLAIAARPLRRAVTIQQITGTQNVFCNQTTATAGNGLVLPATVGSSITLNTTSAIRCIAITGAQTVAIAETY